MLSQRTVPIGAGSRLGAWEIISPLGEGGMCETFVVRHSVAGGRAVAKVLRPELAVVDGVAGRLEREAQILAEIDHPNVVKLFDAGRLEDRPFLIIEWAGALDLGARMKKAGGAIGVPEALWIFRSVLSALERVHALGIVHRDLKPSNIFLPDSPNGLVKLSDFGVSRQDKAIAQTQAGTFYGTPVFMSPEQAQGKTIDARSDLFSLASTIYAALTGRPPFHADSPVKVLMRIVQEEATPPVGLVDPIPLELSDLLLLMLEKDPDARPQSASDVLAELDRLGLTGAPAHHLQRSGSAPLSPKKISFSYEADAAAEAVTDAKLPKPAPAPPPPARPLESPPRARARNLSAPSLSRDGAPPTLPAQPIGGSGSVPAERSRSAPPRAKKSVLGAVGSVFSRWFGKKEEEDQKPEPEKLELERARKEDTTDSDVTGSLAVDSRALARDELAGSERTDSALTPAALDEVTQFEGVGETVIITPTFDLEAEETIAPGGISTKLLEVAEEATQAGPSPAGALDEATLIGANDAVTSDVAFALEEFEVEKTNATGAPTIDARTEPSWKELGEPAESEVTQAPEPRPQTGARRAPEPIEVQLERAGFSAIGWRGQTPEGMMSYDAELDGEQVVVHVGRRVPQHYDAKARVEALRWLIAEKPPLFVPFFAEVPLGADYSAFVRRVPTPERLQDGLTLPPDAAIAVATVTFRALSWLHSIGRRFDDFSQNRVRAHVQSPEELTVMLDVPVEYVDDDDAVYTTAAGGLIRGDPGYFSPGMVKGRNAQHDAGYRAGALLSALLTGQPPFGHDHQALLGIFFRRVSEDPPSVRRYAPHVDEKIARFVDAMVARDPAFRARPPQEIEAEMLAMLSPKWRAAVERILAPAPIPEHIVEEEGKPFGAPREPTLAAGDRISLWTVEEHLHFGGEAELYRVANPSGQRGVMKLWYDDRVDPYGAAWREFRVGLTACTASSAFPGVLDAEVLVRGVARPYVVFEEIVGPTWMDKIQEGPLTDPAEMIRIGLALIDGIGTVHRYFGVLGDLSGRNVLFVDGRGPVLLDVASPGVVRSAVAGFGTAGYAAPEVADGRAPEPASDLFAAGVLLAELALGRRLFPRRVEETLIPVGGFEGGIEPALAEIAQQVGPELARALRSFLAIDPRARPKNAEEARRILDEARARFEVRRAAERRTQSATLTGLERKLPKPIAQSLRAFRISREKTERALLGFMLAEAIARMLAAIALADYLSAEEKSERVEAELAGMNRRLSFGMWVAIAREATRAIGQRRTEAFVPELVDFFLGADASGREALDRIVELRNGVLHHGVKAEAIVAEVDREVRTVLTAIGFLTKRPMLRAIGQRTRRDGTLELEVEDLHGSAIEAERRSLVVFRPPPSDVVFLATQDFSHRLLLDPFVAVRRCECGGTHAFVIASVRKDGRIEYLDQASGHRHVEKAEGPSGATEFFDLIGARGELYLRGELGTGLDEAERWWAGDAPVGRGDVLGRYVLEEEIGRGSMGIVFRARHPELGSPRAVKVLKPELVESDRSLMRRLHQEARIMEQLGNHPGIARVFDYGTTEDEATCFLVMELLEGGSLSDRLMRSPPPTLEEVRATWIALADALSYVHGHGVVHRDLKPSNVLFDREGRPKIADFGVARQLEATRTATLGFEGAPLYAAPEQLAKAAIDPRTDAYALGLLVYDLLRGRPAVLDAQRRALQLRRALNLLSNGETPEELGHHTEREALRAMLARAAALTAAEPEERSSMLGP